MREIMFRGWYGEKIGMLTPSFNGNINEIFAEKNGVYMQYTGLKDTNGKEIYEGDIVEYNDFNSLRTGGHAEEKIIVGKVIFSCGMWMVEENNCGHDLYEALVNDEELEVIGNIYENPELLEEV